MPADGPDHNILKIKPPVTFTIENAQEVIFYLQNVLAEGFMKIIIYHTKTELLLLTNKDGWLRHCGRHDAPICLFLSFNHKITSVILSS
jgi:hypothetical protein